LSRTGSILVAEHDTLSTNEEFEFEFEIFLNWCCSVSFCFEKLSSGISWHTEWEYGIVEMVRERTGGDNH